MRDYTPVKVVRWKVLHLLLTIASTQGALVLTSDQQFAQLRGDITLTCNTSDSNTSVQFEKDKNYVGRCSSFGCEKSNPTKFIVIRNTEPAGYNVTIKDFTVNDAGYYTCLNSEIREQVSGKNITYAVDITSVALTPKANPISVIENTPQLFQCLTSISRPKANVTWYLGSEQLTSATVSSPSQDVTASTLNYTLQKRHQNMKIHCQGSNGGQLRTSDKPMINVLYGPSQIVCKLGGSTMSSGVSVKEGWEFGLDCSSDGNPSPSFSWTHPGDGPSNPLFIRSINRTHAGRFTIIARSNLIPSEQQAVNLTKDIYVNVEVQYPPDPPSCRVGSSAISSNIVSAIRGNTISINCSFDSNPPSRNSWSVPGVSTPTSGQSFDLVVQKATTITLTMENSMQFTNGKNEQGRHESPIEVKVLFPPVVKPLKNVTVLEKSQVSVACKVTAGVPNKTVFRWENMSDMTSVTTEQTLRIANISRAQGGYYRCNASNFMEPTGYDSTVGNSNNTVYIDVQCQPSPPTELSLNTLDNKVTFEWKEGFNGGHAQTFVLETSSNSCDSWTKRLTIKESESKHLNGNGKFNVNLSNLEPGVYNARLVAFNIIGAADPVEFKKRFEIMKLNQETLSRDSVGPVIGGTVGGIIAALVVLIVAVVILRRKYTCSIRFAKREDLSQSEVRADIQGNANIENNAAQTSEVMAVTRDTGVYTDLKNRSNCPDNTHLYMPLDESSSKSDVHYQNVKKEDPVYNNTVLKNSAQTEL